MVLVALLAACGKEPDAAPPAPTSPPVASAPIAPPTATPASAIDAPPGATRIETSKAVALA